ncbi:proline-, glutamic acid- and leucine-rich protein 1-like protein isoform X2 [Cinnamomum micranthum f. kanehirae]|uniref:Proline-, glutamic acid-and leucine-rich protein 1-like protein isoform X2 n=1 Tax=Cinnamomum micranthum f. kanehirae TaxID=337451 RepID=A0A3S3MF15_9MAGN|nr:proline-, glutamic acid- and leucine-rich protein 1-like protein isoform X2 [Cinnamomum micranthum f. kanehirae]
MHLNDGFQGLEEETKSTEVVRLLVPPGKDPPPPLGGQSESGEVSAQATKWFDQWLMLRVSTLMQCCCIMLTSPYPVQVTVPVRPLLALVGRVLSVDGSLSQALQPFMTVLQQELICSELPVLHLGSLDILTAVIKGVRSQLLPHAADVIRLLKEYFGRCTLPSLRIRVYSIMQILLISMGVGIALYVAEAIIANSFADLNFTSQGSDLAYSNAHSSRVMSEQLKQPSHKKRKLVSGSPAEQQNVVEVGILNNKRTTPLSVQIAALQALEALLTVGGAMRSECWRSDVDLLVITIATHACNGGWSSKEKNCILSEESTSTRADFQLAALRALLASLLSPACVRPPYLSQGLGLFRQGRQETGTRLAEFCAHALLALEVLIHPRALPLSDVPSGNRNMAGEGFNHRFPFSSSQNPNLHFSGGMPSEYDLEPEDDLYDSWLGNGEEGATHIGNDQTGNANEEPLMNEISPDVEVPSAANLSGDASVGDLVPPVEEARGPTSSSFVELVGSRDKIITESEHLNVSTSGVGISSDVILPSASAANKMPSEKDVVNSADTTDSQNVHLFLVGFLLVLARERGFHSPPILIWILYRILLMVILILTSHLMKFCMRRFYRRKENNC